MVTIIGLIRTLASVTEPYSVLSMKFSTERKMVKFRNGWTLNLTWSQFRELRDSYYALKKYNLTQVGEDLFKVDFRTFNFVGPAAIICPIAVLLERYEITKLEEDVFRIKAPNFELEGSSHMLRMVWEQEKQKEYAGDYTGKVVLDIGGFQGESAVFFSLRGAKKVIIYEPVIEHHRFIKKNIALNHVNAEIYDSGVGSEDCTKTISFNKLDETFGVNSQGQFETEIKIRNLTDVILESRADIAKFDVEGAEICIAEVPNEILRKVKTYILEIHGANIRKVLTQKFEDAGFRIIKADIRGPDVGTIYFSAK